MRVCGIIPQIVSDSNYEIKNNSLILDGDVIVFDSLTPEMPNSCLGARELACFNTEASDLLNHNIDTNGAEFSNIGAENPLTLVEKNLFLPSRFSKLNSVSQLDESLVSVVRFSDQKKLVYLRPDNCAEASEMIDGLIKLVQTQIHRTAINHPAPPFHHSPLCLLLTPSLLKPDEDFTIIVTLPSFFNGGNTNILFRLMQNFDALKSSHKSFHKSVSKQVPTGAGDSLPPHQQLRTSKDQQDAQHIIRLQAIFASQIKEILNNVVKAQEQSYAAVHHSNKAVETELVQEAQGVNERKLAGLQRTIDDVNQQIAFRRAENVQKSELIIMTTKSASPRSSHHQPSDESQHLKKRPLQDSTSLYDPFIDKENGTKRRPVDLSFNVEQLGCASSAVISRPSSSDRTRPISVSGSMFDLSLRPASRRNTRPLSRQSLPPHEE